MTLPADLVPHTAARVPSFDALHFHAPFWHYQQMILEVVARKEQEQAREDGAPATFHIVAPPGSGKTIVGLELVRRFARPAVIFAPTTTIQKQWQEKLALFVEDPGWIGAHSSLDAKQLSDITVLTYQVLSTPGENLDFVERIAIERWVDDLVASGRGRSEEHARDRIAKLRAKNPAAFRREVSKRYRRVKREMLQEGGVDGRRFLHPNAQDLIDRIVALGVGTIVLDECHHLLDYWAFILRTLISSLPGVCVVGLTATLPDPSSQSEYDNYAALLDKVDFEVPTPAVVKEGNLAPYRDLVYFCEPSPREHRYLRQIQHHFEKAVTEITATRAFQTWLWRVVVTRTPDGGDAARREPEPFERFFNRQPALCVAGVKALLAQNLLSAEPDLEPGSVMPGDVVITEEMQAPLTVDDWLVLLETYALQALKVSADPADHARYSELRRVLLAFGITITEKGVRHQRSPGELLLTLSESKDAATVEILAQESRAMGERLRAVVITDYERMSARSRRLKDVLDPDAGSAVRVFRRLVAEPRTTGLEPVLVTGSTVLANASARDLLEPAVRGWVAEVRAQNNGRATFEWAWEPTDDPGIIELVGKGAGWRSSTYVSLLTRLFEQGVTRCLVGTRGLFGEGWDALSLNTLINLTSVTTSTGVQQIRGRSLRLDPAWARKVAHNWDVVCVTPRFDKGDLDLRRLQARHQHTWGIVVQRRGVGLVGAVEQAMAGTLVDMSLEGRMVRGLGHVDLDLAHDVCFKDFRTIPLRVYTERALAAIPARDRVYDLWRVGEDYSNFVYSATHVAAEDLKFRTVYTVADSLKALVWRMLAGLVGTAAMIWGAGLSNLAALGEAVPVGFTLVVILLAGGLVALVVNARAMWRVFRRAFLELPADAVLLDIGRALLAALRDAGLVSQSLDDKYVRVVEMHDGSYQVFLDYASPADSDIFAQGYREILGPVGDARYLIARDSTSLRSLIYSPLWWAVRGVVSGVTGQEQELRAYHRVPDVLASRKVRAEALSRYWQRYVGGGHLIYTRNAEGRRILLAARGQRRHPVRQMAFEFWD